MWYVSAFQEFALHIPDLCRREKKCLISICYYIFPYKVSAPKEVLNEWQMRPQKLVARFIKQDMGLLPRHNQRMKDLLCHCDSSDLHIVCTSVKSPRKLNMVQQESVSYD